MALGAARSADDAYEAARICGERAAPYGINMNFAPSVDVNNNALNPVIGCVRTVSARISWQS